MPRRAPVGRKNRRLIGTPIPGAGIGPVEVPVALPDGPPADKATVAAITATIHELVSCLIGGDDLRYFALYSDGFLARSGPLDPETVAAIGTPRPPDTPDPGEEPLTITAVWNARVLTDGRVGAAVATLGNEDPHPAPGRTYFSIFVRSGDRWLVDEIITEIQGGYVADLLGTPPAATPAASSSISTT